MQETSQIKVPIASLSDSEGLWLVILKSGNQYLSRSIDLMPTKVVQQLPDGGEEEGREYAPYIIVFDILQSPISGNVTSDTSFLPWDNIESINRITQVLDGDNNGEEA